MSVLHNPCLALSRGRRGDSNAEQETFRQSFPSRFKPCPAFVGCSANVCRPASVTVTGGRGVTFTSVILPSGERGWGLFFDCRQNIAEQPFKVAAQARKKLIVDSSNGALLRERETQPDYDQPETRYLVYTGSRKHRKTPKQSETNIAEQVDSYADSLKPQMRARFGQRTRQSENRT